MTRVVFHGEAEAELLAAAKFYDRERRGLGGDFLGEVERATRAIIAYPELGQRFTRRVRRLLVRRYPYGVLYHVNAEGILVVAVAHLRRRPMYWRHRRLPNKRLQPAVRTRRG